jgi:aminoglycoside 6-adenylyltransferase
VLDQLLAFARNSPLVRSAWQNGSRVNPRVCKDPFSDYDIVFCVTDPDFFLNDQTWIAQFGELIILQQNDFDENGIEGTIFLMLFTDGVRIDLSFVPADHAEAFLNDTLIRILLDKEGILPFLAPPSDSGYWTAKPSRKEFDETANEFWWCSTNVAKGIWRDELPYARYMYDVIVLGCLEKMVGWTIAGRRHWQVNPGYHIKWARKLLPPDEYAALTQVYAGAEYADLWRALTAAGQLFRKMGQETAAALGYSYPLLEDERVRAYWQWVQDLRKEPF